MKKAHEIDQIALLKDVWQTFRQHFEEMLNEDFKQGIDPGGSGRLDVEIIINSLEWCKSVIAKHYEYSGPRKLDRQLS